MCSSDLKLKELHGFKSFQFRDPVFGLNKKFIDEFEYFMIIRGIDNQYARGKIELGISFIKELPYEKDEIIMVGDTVHDSDVADAMGIDCLLIDHGHMGNKKLKATGRKVFSNIEQVRDHLT